MNKGHKPADRLAGPNAKVATVLPVWQIVAGLTLILILGVVSTQCSTASTPDVVPDAGDSFRPSLASDLQAAVGPDIGTKVDGATAILTGEVATESARTTAEDRALALPGITEVDNRITVRASTEAVVDYSSELSDAGFSAIDISVDGSTATLRGEVPDVAARRAASEAALALPGITVVDNQLTITLQPLLALAVTNGNYNTFLSAVDAAGLRDTLDGPGPFTIFAPTDEAFSAMPPEVLSDLIASPDSLRVLLLNHTVEGSVSASEVQALDGALTIGGATVLFETIAGTTTVDEATLVDPDLAATNGIMHGIGAVLDPQILVATNPDGLQAVLADLEPIIFETGRAVITAEGEEILGRAAETIRAIGSDVLIAGHTDDQGDAAANQVLSEARAASVATYLVTLGVPEELLSTVGFGESQPVADNGTSEGRAQNRRIEFVVENAS